MAVLCAATENSADVLVGTPLTGYVAPYSSMALYLYHMTTGALETPGWGPTMPFTIGAAPISCGLIFDGVETLYVIDKYRAGAAATVQQISACVDAYGTLHIVYCTGGNVMYANANPFQGALSSPVTIGAGSRPGIVALPSGRLRVVYEDSARNYVNAYSSDRGAIWGND